MNRIIKTAVIAAIAGIGVIGSAGAAQAFAPTPEAGPVGQHIGTTVTNPDRRDDDHRAGRHERPVDRHRPLPRVRPHLHPRQGRCDHLRRRRPGAHHLRRGDHRQIDTTNQTVTWKSEYLWDGQIWVGHSWGVSNLPYTVDASSGNLDWNGVSTGDQAGFNVVGGFRNVPAAAPAPVAGNHGEYVSGAVKAGVKGKELAAIAQDGTLVGPYPTNK